MWLWRQNQAKARLVVRIACVTLAVHLCLMGLLFLAYGQSSVRSFTVTTQKPLHGQRIIVLPFHKKIPKMAGRSASKHGSSGGKRPSSQTKAAIVPKKSSVATHAPTTTKTAMPTQVSKTSTKIKQKSTTKKALIKKAKVVAKIKDVPKKQKIQKVDKVKKKAPQVDKTPEPEIKKQIQEIEEKPVLPTLLEKEADNHEPVLADAVAESSIAPAVDADGLTTEDAVYMHQDEYDILVMYEQIQAEVARYWRPPPGVAPDTSCTLSFYVDWHGHAQTCTTVKASMVLMFDMSARASLKDMVFPRSSYGKEITLTFMQEKML